MNKHLIEVITSVPQNITINYKHLTSLLFINNIIDMNFIKSFTWENFSLRPDEAVLLKSKSLSTSVQWHNDWSHIQYMIVTLISQCVDG